MVSRSDVRTRVTECTVHGAGRCREVICGNPDTSFANAAILVPRVPLAIFPMHNVRSKPPHQLTLRHVQTRGPSESSSTPASL
eukprot:1120166-Rhodomonas_salina.5